MLNRYHNHTYDTPKQKHIMSFKKINATLFISVCIFFIQDTSLSGITEKELSGNRGAILSRILSENDESKERIHQCLSCLIKDGSSGIRLIDKLGLFIYDSSKHGIMVEKTWFYSRFNANSSFFSLHFVMKEKRDNQRYTLYLEYEYRNGQCIMRDAYFSLVFEEKIREIRSFFGNR